MDISGITDLKELKALAYDQIAQKEQAEANLNLINQRIAQLSGAVIAPPAPKEPAEAQASLGDAPSESANVPTAPEAGN